MTVHFIGAGPGAADLLTLRAVRLLGESPVCLYAGTYVTADVLAHCPVGAELVDTQRLDLDEITARLVRAHHAGRDVARLCSGDPSLYSALTEQTRRLDIARVPWDVTPGVPAYAAAAALLGRELTVPERAQTVMARHAYPGSVDGHACDRIAGRDGGNQATLVLHLAITRVGEIAGELMPFYGADCLGGPVHHGDRAVGAVKGRELAGDLADSGDRQVQHQGGAGRRHRGQRLGVRHRGRPGLRTGQDHRLGALAGPSVRAQRAAAAA